MDHAWKTYKGRFPSHILMVGMLFLSVFLLASACSPQVSTESVENPAELIRHPPKARPACIPKMPFKPAVISGTVTDEQGPVTGASVRIQATQIETLTDSNGTYHPVRLDGW